MANSTLISLGETYQFRLGTNSVFGVYRNQYVAIFFNGQQGYSIAFRIRPEAESSIRAIMTRNHLRKITSKKLINVRFNRESLEILGLGENIFNNKRTIENFQKYVNVVIDEIERYQSFSEATTEKTALLESLPGPNTDTEINEAQAKLNTEASKSVDKDRGMLFGIPLISLAGMVMGLLSALANVHANQDINPLGKGLIAIGGSAGLFRYLSGGFDKSSRVIVGIMGIIAFIVWDMSRIFFFWILKSDKELSLEELINIYKYSLVNLNTLGTYAVIALVSVIFGAFLLKRTDRFVLDIQTGGILEGDYLEWAKDVLRGQKYTGFALLGYFIASLAMLIPFMQHEYKNWDYISYGPFVLVFLVSFILTMSLTYLIVSKEFPTILLGMEGFNQGLKKGGSVAFYLSLLSALPAFGICFLISYFNMNHDTSEPVTLEARSTQESFFGEKECLFSPFKSSSGEVISYKVCKSDLPYLPIELRVSYKYHQGALNIPFLSEFSIPAFESFKAYIEEYPDAKQLRYIIVSFFLQHDKSEWFKATKENWRKGCDKAADYNCRLTAYTYDFEGKKSEGAGYYYKGCLSGKDSHACRGFNHSKEPPLERKKVVLKDIEKFCNEGSLDYCAEQGWSMLEMNMIDKEKLISLFEKPCAAGNKDACISLEDLKKNE